MRFKHSRFSKSVIVLLGLFGYTSLSNGQGCPDAQDDDLWMAEFGGALPDAAGYTWDDCASQIAGVIRNISPDGWVMHVDDNDGQGGGDDEDRSAYCKTVGVFDDDCQSAVYEISVRTIDGDSDPPHGILRHSGLLRVARHCKRFIDRHQYDRRGFHRRIPSGLASDT